MHCYKIQSSQSTYVVNSILDPPVWVIPIWANLADGRKPSTLVSAKRNSCIPSVDRASFRWPIEMLDAIHGVSICELLTGGQQNR